MEHVIIITATGHTLPAHDGPKELCWWCRDKKLSQRQPDRTIANRDSCPYPRS